VTVLGIDWGERRVGVAISDPAGFFAMPACTLEVTSDADAVAQIKDVAVDKEAEMIVVGLPFNMNGTAGPMHEKVTTFINMLADAVAIPIEGWDERMSSMAADRALDDAGMDNRARKGIRDRVAAQVILQGYLDAKI
jgi:putative Holliday junction resolvase